jgi:excisionase family DNA binding protein
MTEAANRARGGPRRFVKQTEIAERLGVTPVTINRWMKDGKMPCIVIAGRRKITEELFEAWLAERTDPGDPPR